MKARGCKYTEGVGGTFLRKDATFLCFVDRASRNIRVMKLT
jgi:hypothetical protein